MNSEYLENKKILLENYARVNMFTQTPSIVYMNEFGYYVEDGLVSLVDIDINFKKNYELKIPLGFDMLHHNAFMKYENERMKFKSIDLGSISIIDYYALSCLFVEKIYAPSIEYLDNYAFLGILELKELYLPNLKAFMFESFSLEAFENINKLVIGNKVFNNYDDFTNYLMFKLNKCERDENFNIYVERVDV